MMIVAAGGNERGILLWVYVFRSVPDTDFRLQFATVFQLLGSAAQSSGDRGDFAAFAGRYRSLSSLHELRR